MSHDFWILIIAALASATVSGIIGMGGGVMLIAVMAAVLDPVLVVPIHGIVQLTSNGTRALRLLPHVEWSIAAFYVPGLIVGVLLARPLYNDSDLSWFRPAIGLFVLAFLAWDRWKPKRLELGKSKWVFLPAGVGAGILTLLVGAAGPYLAAFFLRKDLDRKRIVATKAFLQVFGHGLKVPAFLSLGFDYRSHLDLILPLLACAVGGTFLGTWLLGRTPEDKFQVAFRVVLLLLALRLVVDPLFG